ncbi:VOC family protein [Erwinia sp. S38]|uniref:VOC family protein n=1 Tax=Erwinia sp. S38 TaxID=2769338 RepID=UPI001909815A|nr:VOC family protein [Erwinia sp. S38]MBK0000944.1 VOC family protein [Erwinia sp. S38]
MSQLQPALDHVVINVGPQLDEAAALFQRLGFQLTARGHHSLGSSNHLAIFDNNYLELLGYEPDRGNLRRDLWQSPIGLSGLVWKTNDADTVYQHLQQQQLADTPPGSFFRPVTLPDGSETEARFRTVRLHADRVPNGRSFFCQHLTPDAVWQKDWQVHSNGVTQIREFVIAADHPGQAAEVYLQLFPSVALQETESGERVIDAGVARIRFVPTEAAKAEFGTLPNDYNGSARMVALSLHSTSLEQVKNSLSQSGIPFHEDRQGVRVDARHAFQLALRFTQ